MAFFRERTKNQNFLLSVVVTTVKMLFLVVLLLGVTATGLLMGVAKAWIETAPPLDTSAFSAQAKTSFIYDRNGGLITDFKGTENRIDATIDEIPVNLINAVIAIEDQRFYTHNGVDVKRILGALVSNVLSGSSQGGSTITQQLIKQTMLSTDQNYKRKLQEAYMALHLEEIMSKDEILIEYLNTIYLGGSNYGVKVAAQDYFGKDVSQLNLRECAMLARIIRDPYKYHPRLNYYSRNKPEQSEDNADYVLREMLRQGLITQADYDEAIGQRLTVMEKSTFSNQMYDNAYFVEYAIYDVVTKMLRVESLEDTSANRSAMEGKLRTGGYSIYTTLDPDVQSSVQSVITNYDNYPATRSAADKVYRASLGGGEYIELVQPQAAAAVIDWTTGEMIAIIGGRTEPVQRKQLNRAYQMNMPVGSSLKPLSVYGPAFDMGNSPGSPAINAPLKINGWHTDRGYPNNYDGGSFTGVESMRKALAYSHNTAAAQALFAYVGIDNSVNYLMRLGIDVDHINATGSGLALGTSGVSVIEMAAAFGAVANEGKYLEPYAFTRVVDSSGNDYINIQAVQTRRQVFKPSTAWMLVDVLEDAITRGTGSRAKFGNFTVAGKTGTNSDWCGVSFAGMTGYYSGAVWIGHDLYKPLASNAQGGTYAAPLWAAVMSEVHAKKGITQDRGIRQKSASEVGLIKAEACPVSGMKPTRACANDANDYEVTVDYYLRGTEPTESCNMHRTVKLCTKSKKSPTKYCKSTKTYGSIYIPEGHPLRASTLEDIREWFQGASSDKGSASFGVCKVCSKGADAPSIDTGSDSGSNEPDNESAELTSYINKADALIDETNDIIDSNENLSDKQVQMLQDARDELKSAVDSGSLSAIKKYGGQLQSLVNKAKNI